MALVILKTSIAIRLKILSFATNRNSTQCKNLVFLKEPETLVLTK